MNNEANIFGYIRFSYLGRSDARLTKRELDQRLALLYAEKRMEERFYLFEKICLPSLRWQSDQDFRVAVFTSPEMPERYKERLENATRDIPQIEIVYDTAEHVTHAINPWMARQSAVQNGRTAHFRLDDDDAIASHVIATIRQHMQYVPNRTLITFPSGLYLIDDGTDALLLSKFHPYIAIGLTVINEAGYVFNPYQMQHQQYYKRVPSLMLPNEMGYIHTAHRFSDTVSAQKCRLQTALEHHSAGWGKTPRRFRDAVRRCFGQRSIEHYQNLLKATPANADLRAASSAPQQVAQ